MEGLHLQPAISLSQISLTVFYFQIRENHSIVGYGSDSKCSCRWSDLCFSGGKLIAFICYPVNKQSTCNFICTSVWKQRSGGILLTNIRPLKE